MGRLTPDKILQWRNEKHDLYTDDRLMTFGYRRDFLDRKEWYYCKYPDGTVVQLSSNIYVAIKEFNEKTPPEDPDKPIRIDTPVKVG